MRQHRSNRVVWQLLLSGCLLLIFKTAARAQSGSVQEGALELLLPTGARTVSMGQAAAAASKGIEGSFWNPALIARAEREGGFLIAPPPIAGQGDATATVLVPIRYVGSFSVTARYISFGEQEATDSIGRTGTFTPASAVVAASFAAPFGDHLSLGISYKVLRYFLNCTGYCLLPPLKPTTAAADFGAHYQWRQPWPISVGAVIRNVGMPMQFRDVEQSDPLPSRADVGVAVQPTFAQLPTEATVRVAADVVTRLQAGGGAPGLRFGTELGWQGRYFVRGGYLVNGPIGDAGPFSLGLGIATDKVQLDVARMVGQASSDQSHFFLSMRLFF